MDMRAAPDVDAEPAPDLAPATLSALSRPLYVGASRFTRFMARWRPYLCPFDILIPLVKRGARVLDIGCGKGLFLAFLASLAGIAAGTGVEVSPRALHRAHIMRGNLSRRPGTAPLNFVSAPTFAEWPSEPFDVVTLIDVLHHVPPPLQQQFFAAAVDRAVPSGGRIIFKDMAHRPLWANIANRVHDLLLARQWIHYVPIDVVERWAADLGLREVHRARERRLWYVHDLRVYERPPSTTS
jgi:2-polyprenyl-3-methyl-5-hydroxy-6-metoxy-1,4-benzoquinol methylase